MDAKYLAEIKARAEKDIPDIAATVFRDRQALLAEVERLTAENADYPHMEKVVEGQQSQNTRLRKMIDPKDQQIATLEKALELMAKYNDDQITNHCGACPPSMPVESCKKHSGSCEDCLINYFIQQAQEQDGKK